MHVIDESVFGPDDGQVFAAAFRYRRIQSALNDLSEMLPFPGTLTNADRAEDALWVEREEALRDAATAGPVGPAAMAEKVRLWLDAYGENTEPLSQALIVSLATDLEALLDRQTGDQNGRRLRNAAVSVPSSR